MLARKFCRTHLTAALWLESQHLNHAARSVDEDGRICHLGHCAGLACDLFKALGEVFAAVVNPHAWAQRIRPSARRGVAGSYQVVHLVHMLRPHNLRDIALEPAFVMRQAFVLWVFLLLALHHQVGGL